MFEAYAIGIRLSLVNHVSSGLLGLSRAFMKTNDDAAKLQKRIKSIQDMAMKGGAWLGAGAVGLGMVDKLVKPAMEYTHQLQLMNTAGMKHLEIVKATQAAWAAGKSVPTASVSHNLAAIRELRMVFGNTKDAIAYMPTVQKLQGVLSNLLGSNAGDQAYTIAKALEMRGAVRDPTQFTTQADAIAKAMVASGGKVTATDFLSAFKYGRTATTGWNDTFTYTILPTLIQEMKTRGGGGGGTGGPGNALMSMYGAVVGGTIPQKSLRVWEKLGLLDPSKIVWTTTHAAKGVEPGGVLGSAMFQANPFEWTQKFLLPALTKAGYTTPEKQKEALQYLFPNRTAGFMATQMVEQPWKFQRDQRLIAQAQGLAAYQSLLKTDPRMAVLALREQSENLEIQLGTQVLPALVKGLTLLTTDLTKLTEWSKKHTITTKSLMIAFTGLSGAMAFGGTVMLLTAGFRALGLQMAFNAIGGFAGILRTAGAIRAWGGAIAMSEVGGPGGIMGIGASLKTVSGGLGLLTQSLAALMAWGIGWHWGTDLRHMGDFDTADVMHDKNATIGNTAYDRIHPFNPKTGKREFSFGGLLSTLWNPVPTASEAASIKANNAAEDRYFRSSGMGRAPIQVHSTVLLDGRKVGQAVTTHLANDAARPQSGRSGYDPTAAAPPIGLNYAH